VQLQGLASGEAQGHWQSVINMDKKTDHEDRCNNNNNPSNKSIKITSLNVRGLRNTMKRHRVFNWLKTKYQGIIFLQETHTQPGDEMIWEKE
jgi:hypothetical protein